MANTNTTETVKNLSAVFESECEKTQKNIRSLAKKALCPADGKFWNVRITKNHTNPTDDVLYFGLNGISFRFQRGTTVVMPEAILEVLERNHEDEIFRVSVIEDEAPKKAAARKKKAEEPVEQTEEA